MPDLSVIIVTYCNGATIAPCLRSLLEHNSEVDLQIILVDNASSDDTMAEVLRCFDGCDARHETTLIENSSNLLYAPAVNMGLEKVEAPMILLLNPDTVLLASTVSTLMRFYREHPEAGFVGPQLRNLAGEVTPSCREFPSYDTLLWDMIGLRWLYPGDATFDRWRMGYFDHCTTRAVDQPMGACLLVSGAVVERIGKMDERFRMFFNDVDWCKRAQAGGLQNYFVADTSVLHHLGFSVRQRRFRMVWLSHLEYFLYLWKWNRKWWQRFLNLVAVPMLAVTAFLRCLALVVTPSPGERRAASRTHREPGSGDRSRKGE